MKTKIFCVALVLESAFLPSIATAADPGPSQGVELGARIGYGIPMGVLASGYSLSDDAKAMLPIWLDIGYRINPNLYAGIYGQYAPVRLQDSDFEKPASDIRFGLNLHYHFSPAESLDPWIGFGAGYEIYSSESITSRKYAYKGIEFANIQGGADFKIAPGLGVGPFLSFSMGQYSSGTSEGPEGSRSFELEQQGVHSWLVLGVRGTYGL